MSELEEPITLDVLENKNGKITFADPEYPERSVQTDVTVELSEWE